MQVGTVSTAFFFLPISANIGMPIRTLTQIAFSILKEILAYRAWMSKVAKLQSTEYRSLHALNKEASEQFNSVLLKGHRINSGLHDIRSLPGLLWLDCGDFLRSSGSCMKIIEYDLEENI